jgi:hypothetical protein
MSNYNAMHMYLFIVPCPKHIDLTQRRKYKQLHLISFVNQKNRLARGIKGGQIQACLGPGFGPKQA